MSWLLDELEALFWIIVAVLMYGFAMFFGDLVSGQLFTEKKKDTNDPS